VQQTRSFQQRLLTDGAILKYRHRSFQRFIEKFLQPFNGSIDDGQGNEEASHWKVLMSRLLKKDQNQAFILVMTTRYQLASVIAIHC
jgi:uncharacterized protein YecA (UPF0149 family)